MMVLLREKASPEQVRTMLEEHDPMIKIAVDIRRKVLAGGGVMHADCEALRQQVEAVTRALLGEVE